MLGDTVENALSLVGISSKLVERWLGRPCNGCVERREKLNQLHLWVNRVVSGKTEQAVEYLNKIMDG